MKIEATIWINSKGKFVSLPFEDFYALARTHEWAGSASDGESKDDVSRKSSATAVQTTTSLTKLSQQLEELTHQFSEEERLLFHLMAVSGWKSSEMTTKFYPLFQVTKGESNKYQLEILKPPESVTSAVSSPNSVSPTKAKVKIPTVARSEVLRNIYNQSNKYAALACDNSQHDSKSWWENAYNVSQMILDHRKVNAKVNVKAAKNTPASDAITNTNEETTDGRKMTLEERVRAKSQLRNKPSTAALVDKTLAVTTSRQSEKKALLELADALRSYSQRRGLSAAVTRLSVSDFMTDARVAWKAIVHNENSDKTRGGSSKSVAVAAPVTNIDLSRVLFLLRMKMTCSGVEGVASLSGDTSNKRQMEIYLLELIEKLTSLIPNWIHLRSIPSSLSTAEKESNPKKSAPTAMQQNKMDHKSMRNAIIVILNDAVDYVNDVRAKLGGRLHHQTNSLGRSKDNYVNLFNGSKKRSLKEFMGQQNAAADAIIPPSFLKRYDKMLKE